MHHAFLSLFRSQATIQPPPFIYNLYTQYSRRKKRYLFSTNRWADGKNLFLFPRSEIEYICAMCNVRHTRRIKKGEKGESKKDTEKMEYNFPFNCVFFFLLRLFKEEEEDDMMQLDLCMRLESPCIWILKGIIIPKCHLFLNPQPAAVFSCTVRRY